MDLPTGPVLVVIALVSAAACAPFEQPPAPEVEARPPGEKPVAANAPPPVEVAKPEPVATPATVPPAADPQSAPPDTAGKPPAEPAAAAPIPSAPPATKTEAPPPTKTEAPAAKAPAKESDAPAPKKEAVAAKPPAAAPLDLDTLERRLKDTEAIGVFTKLTLKNQVDDLLGRFEAHHGGTNPISLAALRQPYDLLIIKVLTLLQDRDTSLANDVLQSREAIWNLLTDPARFQKLRNGNRG